MSAGGIDLDKHLGTLRRVVGNYRVRSAHMLADSLAHAYAVLVRDHASATRRLARSPYPYTAYATARAAFEAAQDLGYLASLPAEYDARAALAYAIELVETEELQTRAAIADAAAGLPPGRARTSLTPEQAIARDAVAADRQVPGSGQSLRDALAEARIKNRAKRHWSDLSRRDLGRQLATEHPEASAVNELGDFFYGVASVRTHPRLGVGYQRRRLAGNNALVIGRRGVDGQVARSLAAAAVVLALDALRWSGRDVPHIEIDR